MYSAPLKSLLLLTVPSSGQPRNDIWLKRLSTDAGQMCVECNWETIESHLSELDGQQIQLFFHAERLFIGEKEVVAFGIQLGLIYSACVVPAEPTAKQAGLCSAYSL